jgi:hypothetical protein
MMLNKDEKVITDAASSNKRAVHTDIPRCKCNESEPQALGRSQSPTSHPLKESKDALQGDDSHGHAVDSHCGIRDGLYQ